MNKEIKIEFKSPNGNYLGDIVISGTDLFTKEEAEKMIQTSLHNIIEKLLLMGAMTLR